MCGLSRKVPPMPRKKGYKQSPEHIRKKKRFGEAHANWKGDNIAVGTGHSRACRKFVNIGPCKECGNPKSERHHVDGNTANNSEENIAILCRRCHMRQDGRLEKFVEVAKATLAKAQQQRWAHRQDISLRSGDPCPGCGQRLSKTKKSAKGLISIGCRRQAGCGLSVGSYRGASDEGQQT